jgi:hypothetical protein
VLWARLVNNGTVQLIGFPFGLPFWFDFLWSIFLSHDSILSLLISMK